MCCILSELAGSITGSMTASIHMAEKDRWSLAAARSATRSIGKFKFIITLIHIPFFFPSKIEIASSKGRVGQTTNYFIHLQQPIVLKVSFG
jgi:hypothetical protein